MKTHHLTFLMEAWTLRDLTHRDECVKRADEERLARGAGSVRIPFELFFLSTESKLLPLVDADQENRDFAEVVVFTRRDDGER